MTRITRSSRSGGYVLLTTIILLAIVSLAMVGLSRRALGLTVEARDRQRELQRHWGVLTCERFLLPRAEQVLTVQEVVQHKPVRSCRQPIVLGGMTFDVLCADEQAKVNVNALFQVRGKADAQTRLGRLLSRAGSFERVALAPVAIASPFREPFGSLGQVLDVSGSGGTDVIFAASSEITCWGNGKLNFRRASDDALRQVCVPELDLSQIEQLQKARKESTYLTLNGALDPLGLTPERRSVVDSLLTDGSTCHSVWVLTKVGSRVRYHAAIRDRPQGPEQLYTTFDW